MFYPFHEIVSAYVSFDLFYINDVKSLLQYWNRFGEKPGLLSCLHHYGDVIIPEFFNLGVSTVPYILQYISLTAKECYHYTGNFNLQGSI